jgi:hypothetical protein
VVQDLPSKCKTLSSNPKTTKKKKNSSHGNVFYGVGEGVGNIATFNFRKLRTTREYGTTWKISICTYALQVLPPSNLPPNLCAPGSPPLPVSTRRKYYFKALGEEEIAPVFLSYLKFEVWSRR